MTNNDITTPRKKVLKTMANLMAENTPTMVEAAPTQQATPEDKQQQQLVVILPAVTVKALKQAALDGNTTVRVKLLHALEQAGYPVPAGQAVDFRKVARP